MFHRSPTHQGRLESGSQVVRRRKEASSRVHKPQMFSTSQSTMPSSGSAGSCSTASSLAAAFGFSANPSPATTGGSSLFGASSGFGFSATSSSLAATTGGSSLLGASSASPSLAVSTATPFQPLFGAASSGPSLFGTSSASPSSAVSTATPTQSLAGAAPTAASSGNYSAFRTPFLFGSSYSVGAADAPSTASNTDLSSISGSKTSAGTFGASRSGAIGLSDNCATGSNFAGVTRTMDLKSPSHPRESSCGILSSAVTSFPEVPFETVEKVEVRSDQCRHSPTESDIDIQPSFKAEDASSKPLDKSPIVAEGIVKPDIIEGSLEVHSSTSSSPVVIGMTKSNPYSKSQVESDGVQIEGDNGGVRAGSTSKYLYADQLFEGGLHVGRTLEGDYVEVGGFHVKKCHEQLYTCIWKKYGHIATSAVLCDAYEGLVAVTTEFLSTVVDMYQSPISEITPAIMDKWGKKMKLARNLKWNTGWLEDRLIKLEELASQQNDYRLKLAICDTLLAEDDIALAASKFVIAGLEMHLSEATKRFSDLHIQRERHFMEKEGLSAHIKEQTAANDHSFLYDLLK